MAVKFEEFDHSMTIYDGKAYIFGGMEPELFTSDLRMITLPKKETNYEAGFSVVDADAHPNSERTGNWTLPGPRKHHSACNCDGSIYVCGGWVPSEEHKEELEDTESLTRTFGIGHVWAYDAVNKHWWRCGDWTTNVHGEDDNLGPLARRGHKAYIHDLKMFIVGGLNDLFTSSPLWSKAPLPLSTIMKQCWVFDPSLEEWERLKDAELPVETAPFYTAMSGSIIYLLAHTEAGGMKIHIMDLSANKRSWETVKHFPSAETGRLPTSRAGASLVPISDSTGLRYLLYIFGQKQEPFEPNGQGSCSALLDGKDLTQFAHYAYDIWALRLPSDPHSGGYKWIRLPMKPGFGGKLPQPLCGHACEAISDKSVLLWGGKQLPEDESNTPKAAGDGWIITLDYYHNDGSDKVNVKNWLENKSSEILAVVVAYGDEEETSKPDAGPGAENARTKSQAAA